MNPFDRALPLIKTKSRSGLRLFTFSLLFCLYPVLGYAAININAPQNISLPSVEVTSSPQTVYSGDLILSLRNNKDTVGWILTAEVINDQLVGSASGQTIDATITMKSVVWVSGGNGSAAGITIFPDGSRIEADPGFGMGVYDIVFEIQYNVPAYPRADSYQGTSSFVIQ